MLTGLWKKCDEHRLLVGVGIALFCLALFSFHVTRESLFNDEGATWAYTTHTVPWMLAHIYWGDVHPPLFYLMAKAVTVTWGDDILYLRLLSVVGGVVTALLGLGPVRRAFDLKVGLLYAATVSLTPAFFLFAQEARMYTWTIGAMTASCLYGYLFARDGDRRDLAKLGLGTVATAYLHYGALLCLGVMHGLLAAWLLRRDRTKIKAYAVMMLVAAAAYAPWLPYLTFQLHTAKGSFWVPPLTWSWFFLSLSHGYADRFDIARWDLPWSLPAFVSAVALILGGGMAAYRSDRQSWHRFVFFAVTAAGSLAFFVLVSWLYRPLLAGRYVCLLTGVFSLLVAQSLTAIRRVTIAVPVGLAMLVFSALTIGKLASMRSNGLMDEAAAAVRPDLTPDTLIVHLDWTSVSVGGYYFRGQDRFAYEPSRPGNDRNVPYPRTTRGSYIDAAFRGHPRAELVTGVPSDQLPAIRERLQQAAPALAARLQAFQDPHSWLTILTMPLANAAECRRLCTLVAPPTGP